MKIYIAAILSVLILSSVNVEARSADIAGTKWSLIAIGEREVRDSQAYINFTDEMDKVSGNAGCNHFFGGIKTEENSIKFSAVGSTRMMCVDKMEDEKEFLSALSGVESYKVQGGKLTLFTESTAALTFEKQDDADQNIGLESKKWLLQAIKGENIGEIETEAFIRFNSSEKSVGGNTSCNVFGGTAEWSDGKFSFIQGISTLRACIEDDRINIERSLFDGLNNADRYVLKGNELELYRGEDLLLSFVAE